MAQIDANPVAAVRRHLRQMQDLANAGHLSPERLQFLRVESERRLSEIADQLMDAPGEHFEITLSGLQSLHVNGKPVRWRGHLAVIDGERQ